MQEATQRNFEEAKQHFASIRAFEERNGMQPGTILAGAGLSVPAWAREAAGLSETGEGTGVSSGVGGSAGGSEPGVDTGVSSGVHASAFHPPIAEQEDEVRDTLSC